MNAHTALVTTAKGGYDPNVCQQINGWTKCGITFNGILFGCKCERSTDSATTWIPLKTQAKWKKP